MSNKSILRKSSEEQNFYFILQLWRLSTQLSRSYRRVKLRPPTSRSRRATGSKLIHRERFKKKESSLFLLAPVPWNNKNKWHRKSHCLGGLWKWVEWRKFQICRGIQPWNWNLEFGTSWSFNRKRIFWCCGGAKKPFLLIWTNHHYFLIWLYSLLKINWL